MKEWLKAIWWLFWPTPEAQLKAVCDHKVSPGHGERLVSEGRRIVIAATGKYTNQRVLADIGRYECIDCGHVEDRFDERTAQVVPNE